MYFAYPFGLYSEYPPLLLQDAIIMLLMVLYTTATVDKMLIAFVPFTLLAHSFIALKMAPNFVPIALLVSD